MMNCQQFQQNLDDYLDDALESAQRSEFDHHLAECEICKAQLKRAQQIQSELKNITLPEMSPGFAQRAIRTATQQQPEHHHRRGFITGFSTAAAAGLALALIVAGLLPTTEQSMPTQAPMVASIEPSIPEITLSVEKVQMVNLVFDSTQAVANAELSLALPAHVELSGYPGQKMLAWTTNLKQGRNVLSLPIKALTIDSGELVAKINSNGKVKSIRVQLQVDDSLPPQVMYAPIMTSSLGNEGKRYEV